MSQLEVIVCGGRHYEDRVRVAQVLGWLNPAVIIQGVATGADQHACEWGHRYERRVCAFPPDWDTHGKAAGPMRNGQMLTAHPRALVVAFPGGRGTADMVEQARKANRSILLIDGGPA